MKFLDDYLYINIIYRVILHMKIIIVEGTDRTGKDTLINELKNMSNHTLIIHCGKPVGNTLKEQNRNQNILFNDYLKKIYEDKYFGVCDLIIFNRAWYGEYVYGTIYRERDKEDVLKMINCVEQDLKLFNNAKCKTKLDGVYYIQLINDSTKLALSNDDGNSISIDENNILRETSLFHEIFNKSQIKKKMIIVNDGDKFRDKNEILKEALDFINQ